MVNTRLVYYLESNYLISNLQSGFRKQSRTVDQLIRLETRVREGFINREHVVAIFFDLEKLMTQQGSMVSFQTCLMLD